ncbi:MAG: hypothetical protein WAZ60_23875 [Desulfosalsimonadaceae bacterium]
MGFKKRFAPMVESGTKRQTIRAKRKDGHNPHPGQTLYLYTGLRTKSCRKLGTAPCKSVEEITVDCYGINVSGIWLTWMERESMAKADGFENFQEMREFFSREHHVDLVKDGFSGLLIKW